MKHSIDTRIAALLSAAVFALVAAGGATAQDGKPSSGEYIPFVTDFGKEPRPAGGGFTINARGSQADGTWTGHAWSDVAVGGGMGLAAAVLLAGAGLALRGGRTRRSGMLQPQAAPPQ